MKQSTGKNRYYPKTKKIRDKKDEFKNIKNPNIKKKPGNETKHKKK